MILTPLLDYQQACVTEALKMKRLILALDTGSGKTLAALAIIEELRNRYGVNDVVVSCPKSGLPTWRSEIPKHTDFSYSIGEYNPRVTIKVLQETKLYKVLPELRAQPSCLIVDESHFMCSPTSLKAAQFRGGMVKKGNQELVLNNTMGTFNYNYGMTATPMMNHIEDLYYQVESYFPGYFGPLPHFVNRYTEGEVKRVGVRGGGSRMIREVTGFCNLGELNMRLRPVMFRHAMQYPVKFFFKFVDPPLNEWSLYLRTGQGILRDHERNFVGRLPDLQRVANGSSDEEGNYRRDPKLSCKEQLLTDGLNYIVDHHHGCVVFTSSLDTHKRFRDRIATKVRAEKCWFMTGATDDHQRDHIARNFGPNDVLFATGVGGVSLNLQAVNNVIFYDIPWSVGKVMQYLGRVTRTDSTFDSMNVIFLGVQRTIDEYKLALVSSNLHVLRSILSGFGFVEAYFTMVKKAAIIQMRRSLLWGK